MEQDKVPASTGKNPFETYADRADNMNLLGPILKFAKGDYLVGRDGEECSEKEVVALMPGLLWGWIRWEDNFPVEHIMGLLMEGFTPPALETLSHRDKEKWELDNSGKPRDPWQESFIRQCPDELPIIGLEQDSYQHSDRSIGRVKYPLFPVKRWVKAEPYLAAVTTLTGKALKLALGKAA